MVNFIVLHELPFSLVEHAPFQRFIAILNPWFTIVSRTTVVEDVVKSYENRRSALRETIRDSDSRVCQQDGWLFETNLSERHMLLGNGGMLHCDTSGVCTLKVSQLNSFNQKRGI